jgi:hypothetical protein
MVQKCGSASGNVDRLQRQAVHQLAPVGGDHVGGGGQAGGAAEFGHHLAAREHAFGAARVFGIGHHAVQVAAQADGVLEQPAAVRVERDARLGKALVQRADGLDFFLAAQHAALELEVGEAVARMRRLGQRTMASGVMASSWRRRSQSSAAPGRALVGQVGLLAVAHVEEVAQHLHRVALLAFAEQGGHRHIEELAQQVEQRGFHRGDGMDGHAQVEGLLAAAAAVAVGEGVAQAVEDALCRPMGWPTMRARVFQRLADLFAAGHFAHAGAAGAVGQDQQVAGEEGPCAPLRFSSMLSWPATGTTRMAVTTGAPVTVLDIRIQDLSSSGSALSRR